MDKDELIAQLRAQLSWALAKPASNPAFQAGLELKREQDPLYHINPLGVNLPGSSHLFKD